MSDGGFCTHCGHRVESFDGLTACPACGTTGVPCSDHSQVMVSVNWQELRVLVIWAENYARSIDAKSSPAWPPSQTIYAIARRLEDQHPDRALRLPLSLAGEIRQLKDHFGADRVEVSTPSLAKAVAEYQAINDLPPAPSTPTPGVTTAMHPAIVALLRFFAFDHLPSHLQEVSRPFGELAQSVAMRAPDNPETTVALRKLLEAKDCAVRAIL